MPRVSAPQPPPIDINKLQNTYNELRTSSAESPLMLDMFALMLNIHSKQSETEEFKTELKHTNARLEAVEAKIGGINEVSEKLGLAVRQLPLPTHGYTDLDTVKQLFAEIRAPGVIINRDIIKAVRKLPANPSQSLPQLVLGTVLVEMRDAKQACPPESP